MGAKTWMLVYSDDQSSQKLQAYPKPDFDKTVALLARLFPRNKLERIGDGDLSYTCPARKVIYAGCFDGFSVVAAREFGVDNPSQIDEHFISESPSRNIYLHAMHSTVDWFAYAKWQDGVLNRSLSLTPDAGVIEDIGEKLSFELPYWNGEHVLGDEEYPLTFHPLELGEEALKTFFGYQLEGDSTETLIKPEDITLFGFKRTRPWWHLW